MQCDPGDSKKGGRKQNRFPRKQLVYYLKLRILHADELSRVVNTNAYQLIQSQMLKEFGIQRSVRNLRDKYSHLKCLAKAGKIEDEQILELLKELEGLERKDEFEMVTFPRMVTPKRTHVIPPTEAPVHGETVCHQESDMVPYKSVVDIPPYARCSEPVRLDRGMPQSLVEVLSESSSYPNERDHLESDGHMQMSKKETRKRLYSSLQKLIAESNDTLKKFQSLGKTIAATLDAIEELEEDEGEEDDEEEEVAVEVNGAGGEGGGGINGGLQVRE